MTSMNILPAVHSVSLRGEKEPKDSPVIRWSQDETTEIALTFSLSGLNKIVLPHEKKPSTFYILVFLVYQEGGRDFEIVSSADYHFNAQIVEHENIQVRTKLGIPADKQYAIDLIHNYFYLNIVYSNVLPEDGSDINFILQDTEHSLFNTKLYISPEVESDGN